MDSNDGLDNFVTEQSGGMASSTNPMINRPRLKKIKRPKIRPSSDLPPSPAKVFAQNLEKTDVSSVSDEVNESVAEDNSGTDLMTPKDINVLLQERQKPNPYILDSLPPDFSNNDMLDEIEEEVFPLADEKKMKKKLFLFSLAFFLVGMLFHSIFFSSPVEEKYGLEGVILNSDIPAGRPRCGLTEKTQACVFYLMNCYKQELTGRDFYKLAAQLTGREEYMIETENLHYATTRIPPGRFAQINIPAME